MSMSGDVQILEDRINQLERRLALYHEWLEASLDKDRQLQSKAIEFLEFLIPLGISMAVYSIVRHATHGWLDMGSSMSSIVGVICGVVSGLGYLFFQGLNFNRPVRVLWSYKIREGDEKWSYENREGGEKQFYRPAYWAYFCER